MASEPNCATHKDAMRQHVPLYPQHKTHILLINHRLTIRRARRLDDLAEALVSGSHIAGA
jgi:hypothetical protein